MNSGLLRVGHESFMFEFEEDFPTFVQVGNNFKENERFTFQASLSFGLIFLVTKKGFVHLFDLESSASLYSIRFSQIPLFAVTSSENGGIIGINESGQVLFGRTVRVEESDEIRSVPKS